VVIVTGGGSGLGRAFCYAFADEGASIVCPDINFEDAKETVAEITKKGGKALAIKTDVTKEDDVRKMVDETLKAYHKIDVLVNNAGIRIRAPVEEMTTEQWDAVMNVNLKATFLCCREVGQEMIKNKRGKIINISSQGGYAVVPEHLSYCVSKAAVLMLTRGLAVEWGKYNINVVSVSPGATETPMLAQGRLETPEAFKAREARIPLRRVNQPEDVSNAVLFLASSESDTITGVDLDVGGGMLAIHPGYS